MSDTANTPSTPPVERLNSSDVRQHWREVLERVYNGEAEVIVEKNGIPVAAVVSIRDYRLINRGRIMRQRAFEAFETTLKAFEGIPTDELEREIERAIAEVRAEARQQAQAAAGS